MAKRPEQPILDQVASFVGEAVEIRQEIATESGPLPEGYTERDMYRDPDGVLWASPACLGRITEIGRRAAEEFCLEEDVPVTFAPGSSVARWFRVDTALAGIIEEFGEPLEEGFDIKDFNSLNVTAEEREVDILRYDAAGAYTDPSGERYMTMTGFVAQDWVPYMSWSGLSRFLKKKEGLIRKIDDVKPPKGTGGGTASIVYHVADVRTFLEGIVRYDAEGVYTDPSGEQYMTKAGLVAQDWVPYASQSGLDGFLKEKEGLIRKIDDVKPPKGNRGAASTVYHVADVRTFLEDLVRHDEKGVYIDPSGEQYMTIGGLVVQDWVPYSTSGGLDYYLKEKEGLIRKIDDVKPPKGTGGGTASIVYHVADVRTFLEGIVRYDAEGVYTDPGGEQYMTKAGLVAQDWVPYSTSEGLDYYLKKKEGLIRKIDDMKPPKGSGARATTVYHVADVRTFLEGIVRYDEKGVYIDPSGEQYMTKAGLVAQDWVPYSTSWGLDGFLKEKEGLIRKIDDVKPPKGSGARASTVYHVADVRTFLEGIVRYDAEGVYTDPSGEQYMTKAGLVAQDWVPYASQSGLDGFLKEKEGLIRKIDDTKPLKGSAARASTVYHVADVRTFLEDLVRHDEKGVYIDPSGEQYMTKAGLVAQDWVPYLSRRGLDGFLKEKEGLIRKIDDVKPPKGTGGGTASIVYHVADVRTFLEDLVRHDEKGVYIDPSGEQYMTIGGLVAQDWVPYLSRRGLEFLKKKEGLIRKIDDVKPPKGNRGAASTVYHVADVRTFLEDLVRHDEKGVYIDPSGEQYMTKTGLVAQDWVPYSTSEGLDYYLKKKEGLIRKIDDVKPPKGSGARATTVYHVADVRTFLEDIVRYDAEGVYIDPSGEQYMTKAGLVAQDWVPYSSRRGLGGFLKEKEGLIRKIDDVEPLKGSGARASTVYHVADVRTFLEDIVRYDAEGVYIDPSGEQYMTKAGLVAQDWVPYASQSGLGGFLKEKEGLIRKIDDTKPPKGSAAPPSIVYHVADVRAFFASLYKKDVEMKRNIESLEQFLTGVFAQESGEAKSFASLVDMCGASNMVDILYRLRPEYSGIPVERVKGMIAEYLGDFLVDYIPDSFDQDSAVTLVSLLSEQEIEDDVYENLKRDCLHVVLGKYKQGEYEDEGDIIEACYDYFEERMGEALDEHKALQDLVQRVLVYYESLYTDFRDKKPAHIVDRLSEDRTFPDVNQMINIRELSDKKRLLIADEMGLGKSGSTILAKEYLGMGTAFLVLPSNVMSTWQRYLSDVPGEGYFTPGEAPNVCVVESPDDLREAVVQQEAGNPYDYVLISQEKFYDGNEYIGHARALSYDMLCIDEVHKIKNLKGVRSEQIFELAEEVRAKDKYTVMLSGTPAPNRVEDIAVVLKLLHPDRFAEVDNKVLVRSIVDGDILDLKALLHPYMQMKELRATVDMPELTEEEVIVEMSPLEEAVYETLLEEDELSQGAKMTLLRQFLLNPSIVEPTPSFEGSKVVALREELHEAFTAHDKVLVFVNDYVEGVIRGDDIVERLQLPKDIVVRRVHGKGKKLRDQVQREFASYEGKMLLLVSGQTADVGVDYSSAEHVIHYNEPWRYDDKRQQVARAYRPGLEHDLTAKTFLVAGTIEEGMYQYIRRKMRTIDKLLKCIPITELDKAVLKTDKNRTDPNLEVNPELARHYFSAWQRIMRMFGSLKGKSEEMFKDFLARHGRDYAGIYEKIGARSYQGNANRIAGTLIHDRIREREQDLQKVAILDVASGPEMLRRHMLDDYRGNVVSMDLNVAHFREPGARQEHPHHPERPAAGPIVGSFTDIPHFDHSFDYVNLSFAWFHARMVKSRNDFERLQVLTEVNRVLRTGGRAYIQIVHNQDLKDWAAFELIAGRVGFRIVRDQTGTINGGEQFRSNLIVLEKVAHSSDLIDPFDQKAQCRELLDSIGKRSADGLKFRKDTKSRVRDQRRMATTFEINGVGYDIQLNRNDRRLHAEEQRIYGLVDSWKSVYGSIRDIPDDIIIANDFVRILIQNRYILFKQLEKGQGAVVVR